MASPIDKSHLGLYPVFNPSKLSYPERKRVILFHIILAVTTFGIGHAILCVAYWIQKCNAETEKVNRVAQAQLNPGAAPQILNPATAPLVEQGFSQFKDLINASISFYLKMPETKLKTPYIVDIEANGAKLRLYPKYDEDKFDSFLQAQKSDLSNNRVYYLIATIMGQRENGPDFIIRSTLELRNHKVIGIDGPTLFENQIYPESYR